jgi:hypothetical protein
LSRPTFHDSEPLELPIRLHDGVRIDPQVACKLADGWKRVVYRQSALCNGSANLVANGGQRQGIPAVAFFIFGAVALLASALDLRMIRAGGLRGAPRLARHLWRMSAALLVATLSFVSRPRLFPAPLRSTPVLLLPVIAVLVTMIYWLWRVRAKRARRFVARFANSEAV